MVNVWRTNADGGWVCCTWKKSIGRPDFDYEGFDPPILFALTSDGNSLVTYSNSRPKVTLWNLADNLPPRTFALPGPGELKCLALSPDGKLLAAGFRSKGENRLLVWETAGQTLKDTFAPDLGEIKDVAFSGKGNDLAFGGTKGCAVLAGPKFQPGNRLTRFGPAKLVRFSPDHKLVAFADFGLIHLWDLATNREVAVFRDQDVTFLQFAKDSQLLVGVGASGSHWGG
jgi:WD40 repeat protein